MKKFLLIIIAFIGALVVNADTWYAIGTGFYEDPLWYWSDDYVSGEVDIEESYEHPGYYRFKHLLSGTEPPYMYINCTDPNKVYVVPYTSINTLGNKVKIIQLCEENGWYSSLTSDGQKVYLYGTLENNMVQIPGNYFIYFKDDDIDNRTRCSSDRNFIFKLPSDGDGSLQSGVYFGIAAFNHLPKFYGIDLLDSSNKQKYFNFVNGQKMDDYTYLYYSVDKAIDALTEKTYPKDLSSVALITFTDGNDDGSLDMVTNTSWTDIDYQKYISNKVKNTFIQRNKMEAFSIGLEGRDYNKELFKSNLLALASDDKHATEVTDMVEVERTLNHIIDQLQDSWLNKKVSVKINMRGTGDRLRFTLDKTRPQMNNNPENSDLWVEGVFLRDDLSLNNVVYHGFTSTSGDKVIAEKVTIDGKNKYQFTFENLRDKNGNPLETGEINFWHKNEATPAWQPHTEFGGAGDVETETEYTSAAVMLVMDCSSSLGATDFAKLKSAVNSVIERLAEKKSGVDDIVVDEAEDGPVEYYNLQGQRVVNPSHGIYIQRQGNKAKKIYVR